jgi:hypothetical protein
MLIVIILLRILFFLAYSNTKYTLTLFKFG